MRDALEESLHGWSLQRPCSESDFAELWANVRHKLEHHLDWDGDAAEAASQLKRGSSSKRSLLRHCFPFSDDMNHSTNMMKTLEGALCAEDTMAVCESVYSALFATYFVGVSNKFQADNVLPLLRAVTQTQSGAAQILSVDGSNRFLTVVFMEPVLLAHLKQLAGISVGASASSPKRLLFLSERDTLATRMAVSVARKHGGSRVEVFGVVLADDAAAGMDAGLAELGRVTLQEEEVDIVEPLSDAVGSVGSVAGIAFDTVVVIGEVASVPVIARRRVDWGGPHSSGDIRSFAKMLVEKTRPLLVEMGGEI